MTREKMIDLIENGSDIMLDVAGEHLVIFTWIDDGIGIGRQNSDEPLSVYKTAEQLLDGYLISGLPISAMLDKVSITDYS